MRFKFLDMTEREFKKLYNLYFRPLCLYALHYVSDAAASEDIVQDSFVAFWEKYIVIDKDMNSAAAKSVLFVIVRNRCTDWLKKVSPDRLLPEDADGLITDGDAQERSFDEAALWSAIDKLPDKRRKILIMNKRDGMSYKEIAEELRVSVLTVRNHLALAMKELRRAKPVIQVILTLLMMLFPPISYGQEKSVLSSMKAIESGFGYNFVYESSVKRLLESETKQVKFDGKLLEDCLKEMFDGLPIKWEVRDKTHSIILIVNDNVRKATPRSYTISGYITDVTTGETLISAEIVSDNKSGAVTNNYGFYSLSLPKGAHETTYSYIGCEPISRSIELCKDTTVNIALTPSLTPSLTLKGSVVSARKTAGFYSTYSGSVEVPDKLLRTAPSVLGEPDVFKTLQMLPGIQAGTSFFSGIYVRGGNSDENLVLLDGVPVYNVSHLFGALSIFTPEAVKKISVYKGSFPARYGGRASSIVDIRTNDGNTNKTTGCISIELISDKFHLDGPMGKKGNATYSVSARGMHTLFFDRILKWAGSGGNYAFYDLNLKLSGKIGDNNRLIFNAYSGKDFMRTDYSERPSPDDIDRTERKQDYNVWWGNTVMSIGWNHVFNGKLFSDLNLSVNGYNVKTKSRVNEFQEGTNATSGKVIDFSNVSKINDISVGINFDYAPSSSHMVRFGGAFAHHKYAPEDIYTKTTDNIDGNRSETYAPNVGRIIRGEEMTAYIEDDMSISDWLYVIPGLRFSLFNVDGRCYPDLEPRLSVKVNAGKDISLRGAYSRMSQHVHQLVSGNLSLPTDLWVPVTADIPPVKSDIYTAGITYGGLKGWEFSAEVYWRRLDNVLETKDGKLALSTTEKWEDNVATGVGRAYGTEVYVQKTSGKVTGICSYTLSKSERRFPDKAINNGKWYPFANDRRHNIRIAAMCKFNDRIDAAASWVFMSGNYMTVPERETVYVDPEGKFHYLHYVSGRNNYKLPPTHHLDLSVNFTKHKKKGERVWTVGLYNAYCAMNPDWTYVNDIWLKDGAEKASYSANITKLSFLTILPSVSYTYRF